MSPESEQTWGTRSLLVGVANPATIPKLMALAADIGEYTGCRVAATHVVVKPGEGIELPENAPEIGAAEQLLRQAVEAVADRQVDVDTFVEVADDPEHGLLSAAQCEDADLLLVGYSDDVPGPDEAERAFDRLMHRVAQGTTSDLVVAKFRRDTVNSVLVPIACDINLPVSSMLAKAIGAGTGAQVRFLHLVEPGSNPDEEEFRVETCLAQYDLLDLGECEILRTARPAAALLEQANEADLTIVGTAAKPSLADAIFGTVAERIAGQSTSTVLLVRARRQADT